MNWRMLITPAAIAVGAVAWREIDDWRDRRKARALAEQKRREVAMLETALQENSAFDELAARRRAEADKQFKVTPRTGPDIKRAA